MIAKTATAEWQGNLKAGEGRIEFGDGRFAENYNAASRFDHGEETNPEELIAGAHAGCFSMALAHVLAEAGHAAKRVHTEAKVSLEKQQAGFAITTIDLRTEAEVPELDDEAFQEYAEEAKENCPVSKALAGCDIRLKARLV